MSELPPHLESLLESARSAHDPRPEDMERVHKAIKVAIGATAVTATATAVATAKAGTTTGGMVIGVSGLGAKLLLAAALLGSAGTLYTFTRGASPESVAPKQAHGVQLAERSARPAAPAEVPRAVPTTEPAAAVLPEPSAADVVSPPPSATETRPAPSAPTTALKSRRAHHATASRAAENTSAAQSNEALAPVAAPAPVEIPTAKPVAEPVLPAASMRELSLMRQTLTALRDGQPARALSLLQEQAQQFPGGVLSVERQALRVVALCELGELTAGRAERKAFLARHPHTPLTDRVRAACAEEQE